MQVTLRFFYLLSLTFWIGSMFFFSAVAAPSIFKVLSRETAGDVVTDIFPKYYLIAYACGGIAVLTSILLYFIGGAQSKALHIARVSILVVMLGLAAYAGTVIRTQALEARTEMRSLAASSPRYTEVSSRFGNLHKQSVIINALVFLLGIGIVFITAYNYKE